jgi:hypothetical protein
MWRTSYCFPLLCSVFFVGCSSEPERFAVSGSVSLDGKAVSACTLVFQAVGAETPTAGATAVVSEGKFAISKSNGLAAGEYGVIFTELQPDLDEYEVARTSGSNNALQKKFIPPKYTQANDLRVKVAADMTPISLDLKSHSQ